MILDDRNEFLPERKIPKDILNCDGDLLSDNMMRNVQSDLFNSNSNRKEEIQF